MIGYCTLGSGECHCYDDTTPCPYWVGDCVTPQEFGAVSESGPVAAETIEEMKRRYLAMQAAEYRIDAANLAVLGETIKCSPGEIEEYGFDPQRYIESGGEWHGAVDLGNGAAGEVTVVGGQITSITITNGGPWYKAEDALIAPNVDEEEPGIAEITRSVARGS